MNFRRFILASAVVVLCSLPYSWGAIVLGGGAANGTLDGSGTNKNPAPFNLGSYTGKFGGFLGTAISPRHLITATHLGNSSTFLYADGGAVEKTYNITLAGSLNDLSIYQINGPETFGHWTHVYSGNNEVGQSMVVIGNGTPRGAPVNTPSTSNLAGWQWGSGNTLRSWGTNTVDSVVNIDIGPPFQGDFLYYKFTRQLDGQGNLLNPDQVVLSGGDSGGPAFVLDPSDNQWKLAGINSLVDQVSQTANGPGFEAALFDARGFFDGPNLLDGPDPIPLGSYSTRLSSRIDFINSIAAVPEPGSILLIGGLAVPGFFYYLHRRKSK